MTHPEKKRTIGPMIGSDRRPALICSVAALLVLGSTLACQTDYRPLREAVYPPDFNYIPEDRLQSSMWILAAEIGRLEDLLRASPEASDVQVQREVQTTLRRMSAAVEQIDRPGQTTQHPALDVHLQRFAERLAKAQRGAERTPPNYFQASALSGSCFLCHKAS